MLYWIYDGQAELTKANDIALTMKDNDLQIYNLARQIEQLDLDTDMAAATRNDKQEALNEKN